MGEWRKSCITPDFGNRGEGSASIPASLPQGKHTEKLIYIAGITGFFGYFVCPSSGQSPKTQ
jgi:hypothetical protein